MCGPPKPFLILSKEFPPATFVASGQNWGEWIQIYPHCDLNGARFPEVIPSFRNGNFFFSRFLEGQLSKVIEAPKNPQIQKALSQGRFQQHPGATLSQLMAILVKIRLCPPPSWKIGLWRSNHTTGCGEKKNKNTARSLTAFIFQYKIENNPGFSTAKQTKDAIVLTLGGRGFFPPVCSVVCSVFLVGGFSSLPQARSARAVSQAYSCGCCRAQRSQIHCWCNSTKAPSLTEGTNLALCILNKLLTLLGMKKWLLKSLPPHTNANDSRRTREC